LDAEPAGVNLSRKSRKSVFEKERPSVHALKPREFFARDYQIVVFAGGGNRCWWQAGLIEQLSQHRCWQALHFVGASAGAGIATAFATGRMQDALKAALERFAATPRNLEWRDLLKGRRPFALPRIYPDWIESFLSPDALEKLKAGAHRIDVVITRPLRFLPLTLSTSLALLLYSTEKFWLRNFHSRLPHQLGFRAEHLDLRGCEDMDAAKTLLLASAAAVPITPVHRVDGRPALDGGFYDSVPLPKDRAHDARTLVLLTRYRPDLPQIFRHEERVYMQPARAVPAVNMDCTRPADVEHTYAQGRDEALRLLN
jgi:predicted patatin/cPLA2 family phospholipase